MTAILEMFAILFAAILGFIAIVLIGLVVTAIYLVILPFDYFAAMLAIFRPVAEAGSGSAKDGSAKDGSAKDGSAKDGSVKDGSAPDGSAQADPGAGPRQPGSA